MAVRIKVRDAATDAVLNMEIEPDATMQELLKGAAGYWGKQAGLYVLRKDRTILRATQTVVEARLLDGDTLEFVTEAEATRPALVLDAGEGRSLTVDQSSVLGRVQLERLLPPGQGSMRISNRHLSVWHESEIFAIEDGSKGQSSRNGTTLNGRDIRGLGRVPIRDGDVVGIAGILQLTVRIVVGA